MENLIRKELIDDMFETYEDFGITKEIAASVIDKTLSDDDYKAKSIKKEADISRDMLFGKSVADTCTYLKSLEAKYGKGTVEEKWSGYEDNYFVYEYDSIEDKDDIYLRLRKVVKGAVVRKKEIMKDEKDRLDKIARLESELAILKKKKL